jgi:formate--tetrahydrofolate ligase
VKAIVCMHWAKGGEGTKELANYVVEICKKAKKENFKLLYSNDVGLWQKIETIAKEIYGASEVVADTRIRDKLKKIQEDGFDKLPICIAKTQYSFSTDPNLKGAPTDHVLPIREIKLSSGAEFIVVICGSIMTMPGLPRVPAAQSIKLNNKGEIEGLF